MRMEWKLRSSFVIIIVTLFSVHRCDSYSPAKLLLKYEKETFTLQNDAVHEIEYQTRGGPVRVIGAIGDARVGKSTNLNFIRYFLEGNTTQRLQKVFKTSDSMETCTKGVWMSVSSDPNGAGSTILIDTEGTNLGDNEITDLFSIFTVLMSSGLTLFARDGLQNHNVEFLYRVSRLSEQIWKQNTYSRKLGFPELMVILRDALSPSPGKTLQEEIQDFILNARSNYGQIIGRHFPRDRIKVRDIPFVGAKRLNDLEHFERDEYANVTSSLTADFKRFSFKKTMSGANMDGKLIAKLAGTLKDALNGNRDSLSGLSDAYLSFETSMCDNSFQEIVAPLLRKELEEIKSAQHRVVDSFTEKCALQKEISNVRDKISRIIAEKEEVKASQERLEEQRRKQEEEARREREREEERRRITLEREERLREEQRERERAEEQRMIQQRNIERAEQERRRLEELAAKKRARQRERRDIVNTVLGAGALLAVFSDSHLKENITFIPHSEFEEIGLHGYSWVWSQEAAEKLGLSGIEHGVIAQEVEKLYPWAVKTGYDGYKKVNYRALQRLVLEKRFPDETTT